MNTLLDITFSTVPAHVIYSSPPFWIMIIDYGLTIAAIIAFSPFVYLTKLGQMMYEGKDFDIEKFYGFWARVIVLIFVINSALAVVTSIDDYYKVGRGELVFADYTGDTFVHLPRIMSVSEWANGYRSDVAVLIAKHAAEKGDFSLLRTGDTFLNNSKPATWINFDASPKHFDSDSALKASVIEFLQLIVGNVIWSVVITVFFFVAAFVLIFLGYIIIKRRFSNWLDSLK